MPVVPQLGQMVTYQLFLVPKLNVLELPKLRGSRELLDIHLHPLRDQTFELVQLGLLGPDMFLT